MSLSKITIKIRNLSTQPTSVPPIPDWDSQYFSREEMIRPQQALSAYPTILPRPAKASGQRTTSCNYVPAVWQQSNINTCFTTSPHVWDEGPDCLMSGAMSCITGPIIRVHFQVPLGYVQIQEVGLCGGMPQGLLFLTILVFYRLSYTQLMPERLTSNSFSILPCILFTQSCGCKSLLISHILL